jgi:hypothetical protein
MANFISTSTKMCRKPGIRTGRGISGKLTGTGPKFWANNIYLLFPSVQRDGKFLFGNYNR